MPCGIQIPAWSKNPPKTGVPLRNLFRACLNRAAVQIFRQRVSTRPPKGFRIVPPARGISRKFASIFGVIKVVEFRKALVKRHELSGTESLPRKSWEFISLLRKSAKDGAFQEIGVCILSSSSSSGLVYRLLSRNYLGTKIKIAP